MSAGKLDLIAEQGATFNPVLTVKGPGDVLMDLTGYTARMQVKDSYASLTPAITLTTENGGITLGGALGTISILIAATVMEAIDVPANVGQPTSQPTRLFVYDLELVTGSVVRRLVYGNFTVSGEVTK